LNVAGDSSSSNSSVYFVDRNEATWQTEKHIAVSYKEIVASKLRDHKTSEKLKISVVDLQNQTTHTTN